MKYFGLKSQDHNLFTTVIVRNDSLEVFGRKGDVWGPSWRSAATIALEHHLADILLRRGA